MPLAIDLIARRRPTGSQKAFFGQRGGGIAGHNDVIQHAHVDDSQCCLHRLRQ